MNAADLMYDALIEQGGMTKKKAREMVGAVLTRARETGMVGERVYVPCRFQPMTTAERDDAIRQEFNGQNLQTICRKYGVSRSTVYRIVRK